jgi:hypothetical protein
MSFAQAIAQRGINESRELAKLRARTRYHEKLDRPKIWAESPCPVSRFDNRGRQVFNDPKLVAFDTLKTATSTSEYVAAWCKLNSLKM